MSGLSDDENERTQLARALANPSKEIRDKTVKSLSSVLSSNVEFTEIDMAKLWKALYFCMWLADKSQIQQELAESLASLLTKFRTKRLMKLFLVSFYKTLLREWGHLDQYRINKFYSLIRIMFRTLFSYLQSIGWPSKLTRQLLDDLHVNVLSRTPNGLRFHTADVFLPELLKATDGDLTTKQFLRCIRPFLNNLSNANDSSYHQRVIKRIFMDYLTTYAVETRGSDPNKKVFFKVNTAAIQGEVFDAAANDATGVSHRQACYNLHKEFQRVTKIQFYTGNESSPLIVESTPSDVIETTHNVMEPTNEKLVNGIDTEETAPESQENSTDVTDVTVSITSQGNPKKKKKKRVVMDSSEEDTAAAASSPVDPSPVVEEEPEVILIDEDVVYTKKRKTAVIREPVVPVTVTTPVKSTPKSPITPPNGLPVGSVSKDTSTTIHSASPSKQTAPSAPPSLSKEAPSDPPFIASTGFKGARAGYKFQLGLQGVGYYIDKIQQKRKNKSSKKVPKGGQMSSPVAGLSDRRLSSGSQEEKHVTFGKPKSIDYQASVTALRAAVPLTPSTPSKGVLKVRTSLDGLEAVSPLRMMSSSKKRKL